MHFKWMHPRIFDQIHSIYANSKKHLTFKTGNLVFLGYLFDLLNCFSSAAIFVDFHLLYAWHSFGTFLNSWYWLQFLIYDLDSQRKRDGWMRLHCSLSLLMCNRWFQWFSLIFYNVCHLYECKKNVISSTFIIDILRN